MVKKIETIWNKYSAVIDFLFLLLLTGVAASLAFNHSVWLDESLSMRWSSFPLKNMMGCLIPDVHPPLHYIMLHFVQVFTGGNLIAAKLFCVLGFFVLLLVGNLLLRKEAGRASFYFYSLFLISLPFMLVKTVEVRMYSWSMAFCVLTGMAMYQLMKTEKCKYWIYFTLAALASAYNHYYGVITMVFVYTVLLLFFVIHRNGKQIINFFFCSAVTVVGYLPWLPVALKQISTVNANYWIKETSIMGYLKELFRVDAFPHSTKIYCGIIAAFTILLLYHFIKEKSIEAYWGLACSMPFWGVLLFGIIYGKLVRPIMITRYLIIPLVLLVLGISLACKYINKWIILIICLFFTGMMLVTYSSVYHAEYDTYTDKTINFLNANLKDNDIVVYNTDGVGSVLLYYYPDIIAKYSKSYDIETENYIQIWFVDTQNEILPKEKELNELGISIEEYQNYGIDNVNFIIFKLSKVSS